MSQRRANLDAQRPVPHAVASKLGKYLIKDWAWGHMSPQKLRRIAEAELEDIKQVTASFSASGVVFPKLVDMEALAGIGSKGEYAQNMNKELLAIRLAPWSPVKLVSPIANKPSISDSPFLSTMTPPQV